MHLREVERTFRVLFLFVGMILGMIWDEGMMFFWLENQNWGKG